MIKDKLKIHQALYSHMYIFSKCSETGGELAVSQENVQATGRSLVRIRNTTNIERFHVFRVAL